MYSHFFCRSSESRTILSNDSSCHNEPCRLRAALIRREEFPFTRLRIFESDHSSYGVMTRCTWSGITTATCIQYVTRWSCTQQRSAIVLASGMRTSRKQENVMKYVLPRFCRWGKCRLCANVSAPIPIRSVSLGRVAYLRRVDSGGQAGLPVLHSESRHALRTLKQS